MASTANAKMLQAYDNTLLGILQNEAGLEPFLDVIFGFLSRRTDFYQIMTEPKQKYGFPVGVAEKMIEKVCTISVCFNHIQDIKMLC